MTGQSFVAFLNEYRLNAAAEALQATDETVLTIASRCGFENLSYFNRRSRRTSARHPGSTGKNKQNEAVLPLWKREETASFLHIRSPAAGSSSPVG